MPVALQLVVIWSNCCDRVKWAEQKSQKVGACLQTYTIFAHYSVKSSCGSSQRMSTVVSAKGVTQTNKQNMRTSLSHLIVGMVAIASEYD